MDLKKIRKSLSRLAGWLGLSLCSLIIKIIPEGYLYCFARKITFLGYVFAAKQRKIAVDSLSIAFDREKSADEISQIAKDCFTCLAKSAV